MKFNIFEDKKSKTKSFFFKKKITSFTKELSDFMINYFKVNKEDVRICLHQKLSDKNHDMIILQSKNNFYKPHKHIFKTETYHVMHGRILFLIFNNKGNITNKIILNKNELFRTPYNTYHTMLPLTRFVIYHESKSGPFVRGKDSIFPKWINKFDSKKKITIFKNKIYRPIKLNKLNKKK